MLAYRVLWVSACLALCLALSATVYAVEGSFSQEGLAGVYGADHHGKPTAGGETFDKDKLLAAHPFLPLGTQVRIVNLDTKKTVDVKIVDRGPTSGDRIVDVSPAAAKALGLAQGKTAPVRLESVGKIAGASGNDLTGSFFVQLGAFRVVANAEKVYKTLKEKGYAARLVAITSGDKQIAKVQVGSFHKLSEAQKILHELTKAYAGAFIVAETPSAY